MKLLIQHSLPELPYYVTLYLLLIVSSIKHEDETIVGMNVAKFKSILPCEKTAFFNASERVISPGTKASTEEFVGQWIHS